MGGCISLVDVAGVAKVLWSGMYTAELVVEVVDGRTLSAEALDSVLDQWGSSHRKSA